MLEVLTSPALFEPARDYLPCLSSYGNDFQWCGRQIPELIPHTFFCRSNRNTFIRR